MAQSFPSLFEDPECKVSPSRQDRFFGRPPKVLLASSRHLVSRNEQTPNGEHIYRFIDSISKIIPAKHRDKPRPSMSTIMTSLKALATILIGTYEDFSISNYWAAKCDSLFNTLVSEGVFINGFWEKRRRIGFDTILILGDSFLLSGLEEGCLSWDTLLSKHLSVVLVAACACRSGDAARTPLYTGIEYLAFEDIILKFGAGDQPKDLSMDVTPRAVKG